MNYSVIKKHDVANGPGVRVSLYVSGCSHHCKNCFNPETWDKNYGSLFTLKERIEIIDALRPEYIEGLTILGGDPIESYNIPEVIKLVKSVKVVYPDKSIWLYTGYKFEDLLSEKLIADRNIRNDIMRYIDVIVDGEFEEDNKIIDLRFRGSTNQRIIDVKKTIKENSIILWTDK